MIVEHIHAQAPALCNPPQALTNGDFEDTGTCNTGVTCNLKAFNSSGCGVPGWIEGYGTPDLCQESGNWYAKMETQGLVGGNCATEGIVQTLNLVPGCGYELSFRHRTLLLGGTGIDIQIYLVSGFTHIDPVPGGLSPCPTPDPSWTLIGTISNFNSSSWVTLSQPFSFVATTATPQLLFYPLPVGGSGASIEWNLDDIELRTCTSPLTPQFNAELVSSNTFQFYDQTSGNVTAWCWDFGDGTYSELQNPQHTFAGTGPYNVCLTILDENGCKDQICQTIGSPCQCGTANLTLSQNTTWTNQFVNLGNTLIVPPGRTLTVDASTVKVATGCGIIVQQGARLNVLEGSTLRGWCDGGLWNGVRVEGAGGSEPHPDISAIGSGGVPGSYPTSVNQHGAVYAYGSAQNATTIRDAEIALGNQAGFSFGNGGIIYADGVTFTENRLSGDILPYPALASPNAPPAAPNISRFTNCSFGLNLGAPPNVPTAQGIRIKGSESILIQNCTFDGLGDDAITGTDYTATIKGCTFQGKMPVAVRVQHTPAFAQAFQFIVGGDGTGNSFLNTNSGGFLSFSTGVSATGVSKIRISHNSFENTLGINLMGDGSGYDISDNSFNSQNAGWYGTILNQTGINPLNKSQCNDYGSISYSGVAAWGNNEGYEFIQETFSTSTNFDVYLTPYATAPGSIFNGQGAEGEAVFNLFQDDKDILSSSSPGATKHFFYFYPKDFVASFPDILPTCDLDDGCLSGPNNFTGKPSDGLNDGCLNLPGVGGESGGTVIVLPDGDSIRVPLTPPIPGMSTAAGTPVLPDLSCDTTTCLATIRSKIAELQGLIDGGGTASLLDAIGTAPDATATKDSLLDASPYLSDGVLLAYTQNALTATAKKEEVLTANAPLSDTVLSAAQTEISASVWQQLKGLRDSLLISDREQLEILTGRLVRINNEVMVSFSRDYLRKNDRAALEAMLLADSSDYANKRLAGIRLKYGDFNGAQSLLDAFPVSTNEEYEHHYLQQINLYRLADSTFTLSQAQEDSLYLIAGGTTTQAPLAKALLTVLRDTIFPIELPDEPVQGRSVNGPEPSKLLTTQQTLMVIPNPASGMVKVLLPEDMPAATLQLFDLSGRLRLTAKAGNGEAVFSISQLEQSIYILKAMDGEKHYQAKLVIQR